LLAYLWWEHPRDLLGLYWSISDEDKLKKSEIELNIQVIYTLVYYILTWKFYEVLCSMFYEALCSKKFYEALQIRIE
jgi:hypothetical protein